jgi:hypothetical protein
MLKAVSGAINRSSEQQRQELRVKLETFCFVRSLICLDGGSAARPRGN